MAYARREGFTVRVLAANSGSPSRIAGLGFVVDDRHIVTCAHVVNAAMNLQKRADSRPGSEVRLQVEFPLLGDAADAPVRKCQIAEWTPPGPAGRTTGDLAGLELVGEGLPAGAGPARLVDPAGLRQATVKVFGYSGDPPRRETGALSILQLRGQVDGGFVQLDVDRGSAIRAQPGYSGSPVVLEDDDGDAVIGMLVMTDAEEERDAYARPVPLLSEMWPEVLGDRSVPPCPYKGLQAFTMADGRAGMFVGREDDVSGLLELVGEQSLVIVTGPSGVGKSSLVDAGLIPALGQQWVTASCRPGRMPFTALATALLDITNGPGASDLGEQEELERRVRSEGLATLGSKLALLKGRRILLHVNQLEEALDPLRCPAPVGAEFLEQVLSAGGQLADGLHVVGTLRADFYSHLLEHPDAGRRLQGRLYSLSPMGIKNLQRVIEEPAATCGVSYEESLVQKIALDASGGSGGLPVLEFALKELWQRQVSRQITFSAYNSFGGVSGALGRHAEAVFADLCRQFDKERIRRVMLAMVRSRGGADEATRCPVSRDHLGPDWAIAERLAASRLLVLDRGPGEAQDTADLAHETLIRAWPRFTTWVNEDAEFQHWLTIAEDRAREHDLLTGARIEDAERWLSERRADIPDNVVRLIEQSKAERDRRFRELEQARDRAEKAARQAEARRLAAAAELALVSPGLSRQLALALAIESMRLEPTLEGDTSVRDAIRTAPIELGRVVVGGLINIIDSVAFHPDGVTVAASGRPGALLFNAVEGTAQSIDERLTGGVAFSPDGSTLVIGGDGESRVIDLSAGSERFPLRRVGSAGRPVFSPDGSRLAIRTSTGAQILDPLTGDLICDLRHEDTVRAVAFSPDGTKVATAGRDRTARLFDAATGGELRRLPHREEVTAVAFSPDGTRLATGSGDGSTVYGGGDDDAYRGARIFETATGTEVCRTSHSHNGTVWSVAFSPYGTRLATGSQDNTARVFDTTSGSEICRVTHQGWVRAVAYSPDGTRVATGSNDGTARVFDPADGRELCRTEAGGTVWAVTFNRDGTLAAAGSDAGICVFRTWAVSEPIRLEFAGHVNAVAFCPDGARLAAATDADTAVVLKLSDFGFLDLRHDGGVRALAFSPDATRVVTGSADASARVFDATTGRELCRVDHGREVCAVAFSPDGTRVVTGSADASARVFDAATGRELCRLDHYEAVQLSALDGTQLPTGRVNAVAFSPDGTRVVTGSADASARVFDPATGREIIRLDHDQEVRAVAFSPDGMQVVTGCDDGGVRVYDAATGRELSGVMHDHVQRVVKADGTQLVGAPVNAVAFSPDGTRVVTACADASTRVFIAATGDELFRFDHDGQVQSVAWSRDGSRIATGSVGSGLQENSDAAGSARVFDSVTGRELCRLNHDAPVRTAAFSPDGIFLATGSGRTDTAGSTGSARLWIIAPGELARDAAQRLTRNLSEREWHQYMGDSPYQKTRADLP